MESRDLSLLLALDAMLQEGSVTLAVRRLGLSTPAASHALARIRERLGDPLLVRSGRSMTLTPRAEQLRPADGYSDPEDPSGYSAHDILNLGFKKSPAHAALLQDTRSIDDVDPSRYDAVFVAGGQSPMYTFRGNRELEALVAGFYEAGKVTALVCHATCLLLDGARRRRVAPHGVGPPAAVTRR